MSSSTLAQIAEKPITVTTEETISNFADSRHGRLATFLRHPNRIAVRSRTYWNAPRVVAACLSGDNDALIS
jgi:hypothetical protein